MGTGAKPKKSYHCFWGPGGTAKSAPAEQAGSSAWLVLIDPVVSFRLGRGQSVARTLRLLSEVPTACLRAGLGFLLFLASVPALPQGLEECHLAFHYSLRGRATQVSCR